MRLHAAPQCAEVVAAFQAGHDAAFGVKPGDILDLLGHPGVVGLAQAHLAQVVVTVGGILGLSLVFVVDGFNSSSCQDGSKFRTSVYFFCVRQLATVEFRKNKVNESSIDLRINSAGGRVNRPGQCRQFLDKF